MIQYKLRPAFPFLFLEAKTVWRYQAQDMPFNYIMDKTRSHYHYYRTGSDNLSIIVPVEPTRSHEANHDPAKARGRGPCVLDKCWGFHPLPWRLGAACGLWLCWPATQSAMVDCLVSACLSCLVPIWDTPRFS